MPKHGPKHESKHESKHELDQELQSKYVQYQVLKQQMAAFVEEKRMVDERTMEINVTIDALHKIEEVDKGSEMLTPLGSGAFLRSDLKDTEKVLMAVGSGVVAVEKRERAIEILQTRADELAVLNKEIMAEIIKYNTVLQKMEKDLEKLAAKQQKSEE